MKDKIQSIVVLTVVCVIAAGGLAYVNDLTYVARHPAISPALVEALNALLPAHDNQLDKDVLKVGDNKYYVAKKAGQIVAYAFESSNSTGYNKTEPIDLLLVVDAKGAILATSIISQKETPGLGSKCTLPAFLDQFKGKDLKSTNFTVKKDGGDIDQVSGSTVTSRAVTLACKEGLARFHKEVLKEEVKPMAAAPKTAKSCAADSVTTCGITSSHKRSTRNHEPLTTSAESMALAAAGAPAWAGGSQICSGNSAVLAKSPTVIKASTAQVKGSGRTTSASIRMSSVPYAP